MDRRRIRNLFGSLVLLVLLLTACSSDPQTDDAQATAGDAVGTALPGEDSDALPDREVGPADPETEDAAEVADPPPRETGPDTLVWVHGIEPPDLHLHDPRNQLPTTSWIREGMLESLFGIAADLSYYPELLAGEPQVRTNEDKTVVIQYELREGLRWSDGTPLTSADVAYTHEIMVEGCETERDGSIVDATIDGCVYLMADRAGLDLVTSFDIQSDTKFSITMTGFYADWRSLYSPVYAAHAFGADASAVNRSLQSLTTSAGPLPVSGPLLMERWDRGVSMTLARNDTYHGSVSPDVINGGPAKIADVRIDFVPGAQRQIEALSAGDAHVVMAVANAEFQPLVDSDDFDVTVTPGTMFEHWGFNLLNVHLAKPEVRLAIANAIDKAEVVEKVYRPLFGDSLEPTGLGNTYWMATQAEYVNNQSDFDGQDVDAANAALVEAGYVLGADDVYRHPVDGRLRLRAGTTGGNILREQEQAVLQAQLAAVGIEVVIDNLPGGTYFGERPFAPDALAAAASGGERGDSTIWDITQFARSGGAWPGGQSGAYRTASPGNPYGFANAEFDVRASECDAIVDDEERAECYNELDRFVTTLDVGEDGLVVIPLTQRPSLFGSVPSRLAAVGVAPDTPAGGPLVNVVDFERR